MRMLPTIIALGLASAAGVSQGAPASTRPAHESAGREAAAPTTAPSRSDALQNFRERLAQWRQATYGMDLSKTSHEAPTPQEWKQIAAFSQQNFPNRWKMFVRIQNKKGDDSEVVKAIKLKFAIRYRGLQTAKSEMPDVYQAALDQGQLEDAAWGSLLRVKQDPDNQALQGELHDNVQKLVNAILQERANRLQRLQDVLDQEQQSLDRQRANLDEVVDRQVRRLMSDQPFGGPGFGGGFNGGGMNGGMGPRGRRPGPGGRPSDRDGDRQAHERANEKPSSAKSDADAPADADKPADSQ
ncbi:MAG: hypothetical protein ACTHLZ_15585 [Tepidisphaeraceae bacterium]